MDNNLILKFSIIEIVVNLAVGAISIFLTLMFFQQRYTKRFPERKSSEDNTLAIVLVGVILGTGILLNGFSDVLRAIITTVKFQNVENWVATLSKYLGFAVVSYLILIICINYFSRFLVYNFFVKSTVNPDHFSQLNLALLFSACFIALSLVLANSLDFLPSLLLEKSNGIR